MKQPNLKALLKISILIVSVAFIAFFIVKYLDRQIDFENGTWQALNITVGEYKIDEFTITVYPDPPTSSDENQILSNGSYHAVSYRINVENFPEITEVQWHVYYSRRLRFYSDLDNLSVSGTAIMKNNYGSPYIELELSVNDNSNIIILSKK